MDAAEYTALLARAAPFLGPPAVVVDEPGFGRVAVAGDPWLRARAELYLRGLPELPLDEDQLVDALVLALEELDAELAGPALRAWSAAQKQRHPRGPDGRFRSTVDVLKAAIRKHHAGGGKGDPFDGYDREQLRRVARARGIELKRGEDRDSIAAKLLADLGQPAGPAPRPLRSELVKGRDLVDAFVEVYRRNPVEYEGRRRKVYDLPYDAELQAAAVAQGFDAKPQVVTRAEMDRAVADGWTETWRGVGLYPGAKPPADVNHGLRFGTFEPGRGIYGNGVYVSVRRNTAETFRGRDPKTNRPSGPGPDFGPEDYEGEERPDSLLRIAIDPKARIGDFDELHHEVKAWQAGRPKDSPEVNVFADVGRYAAARGYDVMVVRNHGDGAFYPGFETDDVDDEDAGSFPQADQYVIFNRSAIAIQRAEDRP